MIKIAHFADTHIRNLKFHDEYRFVFNQIYKKLLSQKPDYIVHCGDLAHTKTQLSPKYFALASLGTNFPSLNLTDVFFWLLVMLMHLSRFSLIL